MNTHKNVTEQLHFCKVSRLICVGIYGSGDRRNFYSFSFFLLLSQPTPIYYKWVLTFRIVANEIVLAAIMQTYYTHYNQGVLNTFGGGGNV